MQYWPNMTGTPQSAGATPRSSGPLAVGIDIGTSALKAVAVDDDGRVLHRCRLTSRIEVGPGDRLEHDARQSWWEGPRAALREMFAETRAGGALAGRRVKAVAVAAMMPSAGAVGDDGRPLGPGILYGSAGPAGAGDPTSSDEMARLSALAASRTPGAYSYWPAQAVANASLGAAGVIDLASAFAAGPLFSGSGWDGTACERAGLVASRMPRVAMFGEAVGELGVLEGAGGAAHQEVAGAVLGAGSVDGLCEQVVAGVPAPGDVLVTLGSTLVVWLSVPGWPDEVPAGLWRVPHLAGGMAMVGGASNAGGLWVDWVDRLLAPVGSAGSPGVPTGVGDGAADDLAVRPGDVPIWWPWARGERVPWHDGSLRVGLAGAHLSHGPAHLRRAAFEATGFVVRYISGLAATCGTPAQRYFVSGGGTARRERLQAIAEALGAPLVPMALPDGAALGAAFLARMAAGLESSLEDAARWARWAAPVEPRPDWVEAADERYGRWLMGLPTPALQPAPCH
jgi:xylulokinase